MTSAELDEIKRHFNVVAERLESKISVLADGVSALNQKVEREIESIREEMVRGFAETQAMIKFSYAELDRRVTSLETVVANLDSRLRRLEPQ